MTQSTSSPQQSMQEIAPGLIVEYIEDHAIIIFTLYAPPSRDLVDAWQAAIAEYAHHRSDKRHFIMYDLSNLNNFPLTPYLRERLLETSQQNKDVVGRCAVILTHNPLVRVIIQLFIGHDTARVQPNLKTKIFGKRDLGLGWVREALANPSDRL